MAELEAHYEQVRSVSRDLQIGFAPLGFHPIATRERNAVDAEEPLRDHARATCRRSARCGLDMMTRTCTVQVNLDYRLRDRTWCASCGSRCCCSRWPPRCSPTRRSPRGGRTASCHIAPRSGPTPTTSAPGYRAVMFEDGFGFERYVEWLVDKVPMYFVYRDGALHRRGRRVVPRLHGRPAARTRRRGRRRVGDFADHMTTVFTDVRLKRFLEMRGADAGRPDMMVAQSALWVGLLYDDAALAAAEALVRGQTWRGRGRAAGGGAAQGLDCAAGAEGAICAIWRARCSRWPATACARRARCDAVGAGRERSISRRWRRSLAADRPRRNTGSEDITATWRGDVRRIFAEAAI